MNNKTDQETLFVNNKTNQKPPFADNKTNQEIPFVDNKTKDYYSKYVKYKQKYLNLKRNNVLNISNSSVDENNCPE